MTEKDKELIEVTIPEPEKIEKTTMGNPADVKAEDEEEIDLDAIFADIDDAKEIVEKIEEK